MQDLPQPVEMKDTSKRSQPGRPGGDRCRFCLSREFKRSRLHTGDLFTLLRMRVPARCLRCGQLQTISWKAAKRALPTGSQSETARALTPAMTPAALHDAALRRQGMEPQAESRAAIPHAMLQDAMDIRCMYCPGQMFRRSRLRAKDVLLIARMRYSARCLRCGQRQTVNFMVAGSAVPSNVKQARSLRNTETWKEFTSNSAPEMAPVGKWTPLQPVIAQTYTLKDVAPEAPLVPIVTEVYGVRESSPAPAKASAPAVKKPVDDQSIW